MWRGHYAVPGPLGSAASAGSNELIASGRARDKRRRRLVRPPYGTGDDAGAPRWAYVSGIIVIVLVLLYAVMHLIGGGPGLHAPPGG